MDSLDAWKKAGEKRDALKAQLVEAEARVKDASKPIFVEAKRIGDIATRLKAYTSLSAETFGVRKLCWRHVHGWRLQRGWADETKASAEHLVGLAVEVTAKLREDADRLEERAQSMLARVARRREAAKLIESGAQPPTRGK